MISPSTREPQTSVNVPKHGGVVYTGDSKYVSASSYLPQIPTQQNIAPHVRDSYQAKGLADPNSGYHRDASSGNLHTLDGDGGIKPHPPPMRQFETDIIPESPNSLRRQLNAPNGKGRQIIPAESEDESNATSVITPRLDGWTKMDDGGTGGGEQQ